MLTELPVGCADVEDSVVGATTVAGRYIKTERSQHKLRCYSDIAETM